MENWDDFRIFLKVAKQGSIRQAAKALNISHSTVLRRIDNLEVQLEVRLFERLPSGYHLTQAGEDVFAEMGVVKGKIDGVSRLILGRDLILKGKVRVTMPDVFGIPFLVPHLASFHKQHPGIDLQVDETYHPNDLNAREADIAISLTKKPPEDLVGRKLGEMMMAAYCTESYRQEHRPETENSTAEWIGWNKNPQWVKKSPFPHLPVFGCFDKVPVQIACAVNGVGVGLLPCFLADKELDLVRLSKPEYLSDIWVVYHVELRTTARIRCVRDFIEDLFAKEYPKN